MLEKLLNGESKTVTSAAVLISLATLASRFVGIIRDRTFTHYFGTGQLTDAYFAAFKIPDLIYNLLVVGARTAGFIPTFTKLFYNRDEKSDAWRLVNNIISIGGIILAILSLIGIIFTPWLSRFIAPGFSGETKKV